MLAAIQGTTVITDRIPAVSPSPITTKVAVNPTVSASPARRPPASRVATPRRCVSGCPRVAVSIAGSSPNPHGLTGASSPAPKAGASSPVTAPPVSPARPAPARGWVRPRARSVRRRRRARPRWSAGHPERVDQAGVGVEGVAQGGGVVGGEESADVAVGLTRGVVDTDEVRCARVCCWIWASAVEVGPQPPQVTPKISSTLGVAPGTVTGCPDIVVAVNETGPPVGPAPAAPLALALLAGVRAV